MWEFESIHVSLVKSRARRWRSRSARPWKEQDLFQNTLLPRNEGKRMSQPTNKRSFKKQKSLRTSLVVQWLRIHLPMEGMQVWSLVQEDSTCHRATKSMCCNYWNLHPRAHTPQQGTPLQWEVRASQLESGPSSTQLEKGLHAATKASAVKNKLSK